MEHREKQDAIGRKQKAEAKAKESGLMIICPSCFLKYDDDFELDQVFFK